MKENIIQALFSAALGAVMAYLNILLVPFIVLLVVMITDYLTGMTEAYVNRSLNSRIGVVGILKKIGYIVAVAVGVVADYLITSALVKIGVEIHTSGYIGLVVTIWFIINELISILENLTEIGTPLPVFLVKIVKRLKITVEDTTAESEDKK
ncbi:MAG: holin family protein [Ruminococcus sp.]